MAESRASTPQQNAPSGTVPQGARGAGNPLGTAPVGKLMLKFAIPSIIAMMVGSIYNIVDQLFIGHAVGTLGNAATNVAFPLANACTAFGLLFGIGGASCFNLSMGRGEKEKAPFFIGNAAVMLFACGTVLMLITEIFLEPMLIFFGSPADVLPYALEYVRITAIGFPFLILTTGGGHLVRADGSPQMTMFLSLSGAIINTVLDALFVLSFGWGMFGAALATIIGQILSGTMVIIYLTRFKTVALHREHFLPRFQHIFQIASIGMGSFFNQLAMMVVQITLNNSLTHYGALSVYGSSIPLACAGIVMKVNQMTFSIVIGLSQGSQPIESFNYGAKNYGRVKEAYLRALSAAAVISVLAFIAFQTIPEKLLALFGTGSAEYFAFGARFFRIYMFFTWANCVQPVTSTFFTSIGKPIKGIFMSLTRQLLFLLPILVVLPRFIGIDGILFAGPIADCIAFITAICMVRWEFGIMNGMAKREAG